MSMISPKSYLLRAFYDWIVDNGMTPYVLVDANAEAVQVPTEHVQDGKIVLNISPTAANALAMDREYLSFSARFRGVAREIFVPMEAVKAVYAKENGRGMVFPEEEEDGGDKPPPSDPGSRPSTKPKLKVVK
jgi:stringent starvation protein B